MDNATHLGSTSLALLIWTVQVLLVNVIELLLEDCTPFHIVAQTKLDKNSEKVWIALDIEVNNGNV